MSDAPGSALEKLHAYRQSHFTMGKAYDEAMLRNLYGLPPVENPEYLPETPSRRRLVAMEDAQATKEVEDARKQAEAARRAAEEADQLRKVKDERLASLEQQNAELMERLAALERQEPRVVTIPVPTPAPVNQPLSVPPPDLPTESWKQQEIIGWAEGKGLQLPPRRGFGMTKLELLDHVLGEVEKTKVAATAE